MNNTKKLQYVVVGTGRSGTVYLAKLLTSLDIPCGHERVFKGEDIASALAVLNDSGENSACSQICGLEVDREPIAESSYLAVPFLGHECLEDCTIIHAVRDPVKVIRSFVNDIQFFRSAKAEDCHHHEQFVRDHLPLLNYISDPVCRACYYYVRWNQKIEESAGGRKYIFHRVEDGPAVLLRQLGINPDRCHYQETNCNSYAAWPSELRAEPCGEMISEEEILACPIWEEVATMARKYGYDCQKAVASSETGQGAATSRGKASECRGSARQRHAVAAPQLIEQDYHGYNIILYRGTWYGLAPAEGVFDPRKAENGQYERCLSATSRDELMETLAEVPPPLPRPALVEEGYAGFNIVSCGPKYYAIRASAGAFNLAAAETGRYKELFHGVSVQAIKAAIDMAEPPLPPQLIEQGYHGFNIISYNQKWYGLAQREGAFDPFKVDKQQYARCFCCSSEEELKEALRGEDDMEAEMDRSVVCPLPQLVEVNYRGFNLISYGKEYYAIRPGDGAFDIELVKAGKYSELFYDATLDSLKAEIDKAAPPGLPRQHQDGPMPK